VNYAKMIGNERISDAKTRDAEDLLARLVASAFAADHPNFSAPKSRPVPVNYPAQVWNGHIVASN
jgi:hypothetical protein